MSLHMIRIINKAEEINDLLKADESFAVLDRIIIGELIKDSALCDQFESVYDVKYDLKRK